jgi:tripartite-type tricarboxylate transporter receptor subunit TctC
MERRKILLASFGVSLLAKSGFSIAQGQAPAFLKAGTPIKYVVPYAAGGLTDIVARAIAQRLSENWKVSVVVDNKTGANGQIGAQYIAQSAPDGSQLLAITLSHAANVTLLPNSGYSFVRDLRPVALLIGSPMLIVVPENSPVKDFKDLIATARKRRLNAGSGGNGTPQHLTMALFNQLTGTTMTHVPFRGGAPAVGALVGGQLDVVFANFPEAIANVQGNKLRALAVCSASRHAMIPEVPTTAELGMSDLVVENWNAAMIQVNTPDAVVDQYSREMVRIMSSPELEAQAKRLGFTLTPKPASEAAAFIKTEIERWKRVIQAANIEVT